MGLSNERKEKPRPSHPPRTQPTGMQASNTSMKPQVLVSATVKNGLTLMAPVWTWRSPQQHSAGTPGIFTWLLPCVQAGQGLAASPSFRCASPAKWLASTLYLPANKETKVGLREPAVTQWNELLVTFFRGNATAIRTHLLCFPNIFIFWFELRI